MLKKKHSEFFLTLLLILCAFAALCVAAYQTNARVIALCSGAFFVLFGIIFFLLTASFSLVAENAAQHIISAIISLTLGVYLLGHYAIGWMFLPEKLLPAAEVLSFNLLAPLLCLMLYQLYHTLPVLNYAAALGLLFCAVEAGLFFFDLYDLQLLYLLWRWGFFLYLLVMCAVLLRRRAKTYTVKQVAIQEHGIIMFGLCMCAHIFLKESTAGAVAAVFGSFAFVVTQILNYYLNISESYARQKEYATLSHLAYVDALTGLPNRKSADNVFRTLNSSGGSYCIISIDCNGLKEVNDSLGHEAGDKMLQTTAFLMNEVFSADSFRARLGGDEFFVVLKRTKAAAAEEKCKELNERLHAAGMEESGMPYGISFGCALREEGKNAKAVYEKADARMYERKKAHHAS